MAFREATAEQVVVERNRLLYGAFPTSVAATLVLAATLAAVQASAVPTGLAVGWFVGVSLLTLGRLFVARSHQPRAAVVEHARRYERYFALGAVAGGLGWGAAGVLLFPAHDVVHQAFLGFVVAGVSAGALASLAPSFQSLASFLVPTLAPLGLRLVATGDLVPATMGGMAFLYLAFLLTGGRRLGGMLEESIRLRLADAERDAEVRRSRDLLERVGGIARVGGWEWDVETGAIYWSNQVYALYGLDPETPPDFERAMTSFPAEERGRLDEAIGRAIDRQEAYDLELRFYSADSETRWVRARGQPMVEDGRTVRLVGTLQDVTERKETARRLQTNLHALEQLHAITAHPGRTLPQKIQGILELGLEAFGLDVGIVSRIQGNEYRVDSVAGSGQLPEPGTTFDLNETYCAHVLAADGPVGFEHVGESAIAGHPCYGKFGLESYIGTPIFVAGQRYGTLNFSSAEPRDEPFTDLHFALIRIFAEWIGHEMARVQALAGLAESEERTRLILHSVGDGIFGLDRQGRTTFVNPAAEEILGYTADELLGEFMHELVHSTRPDGTPYPVAECPTTRTFLEGEAVVVTDEVLWARDGRAVPVEYTSTPVHDGGALVGAVVSFRDITERREYERRLTSTLATQRAILDAANYSIIATDVDGTIRTFSRGAERMLGYTQEEMVDRATPERIHDPDEVRQRARELSEELDRTIEPGFEAFVALARETDRADERKWTYIRKDGTRIPVLLSVTAVRDDRGTLLGYLGVAADLTEREKIDRLKSEFVSTVSHELRTPLTSIRGSLGLVAGGAVGELPDRARDLVAVAARNSERLILLINDILDMEKIESGKLEFSLAPQPLMPLVERALEANEAYARQHDTRFRLLSRVDEELRVCVDENRFAQVLANLLSNAAKFTDPGTEVRVRVTRQEGGVRIAVADRGPGIPEEFQPRIFQKFSQADASDQRQKGGTGLGLSITRALMERMNGHIWFDTEPGEGATFCIQLPVWEGEDAPEGAAFGAGRRILVCEPDPDAGAGLAAIVAGAGFDADVVATPALARERLSRDGASYAALLLDLVGTDGAAVELVRWIRSGSDVQELPVISLAVTAEDGELLLGGELRLFDWIEKPARREDLEAVLRRLDRPGEARPSVLHLEDDADLRHTVAALGAGIADFHPAATLARARGILREWSFDLILLDLELPDGSGWEILPDLAALNPRPAVVVFSAHTVSAEDARRVEAALLKSRTTEEELIQTLRRLLPTPAAEGAAPESHSDPEQTP